MQLANLDLNLLLSLNALLEERSVSRAAARIGIGQPAMSTQLARLRRHFDDELLRRSGNTYVLTPLAAQLRDRTEVAVASVSRVFAVQTDFDAATADREFRVVMSDYAAALLGGPIASLLDAEAPHVRLHIAPLTVGFENSPFLGTIDAVVVPHGFINDLPYLDLHTTEWVFLVSADNPRIGAEITLEQLADMPWVLSYDWPSTSAFRQMKFHGVEVESWITIESFTAVPFIIGGTDRVALIPKRLADRLDEVVCNVRVVPCPFVTDPVIEALWWHPMYDGDSGHQWLRSIFSRASAALS